MPMKRILTAGVLCLFLGTIAPAYAQREQSEKEPGKPQQGQPHAQAKAAATQPSKTKTSDIKEGSSLFRGNCSPCHGLNARGGGR